MPSVHEHFYNNGAVGWEVDYRENGKRSRVVFSTREQAAQYMLQEQLRITRNKLHELEQQMTAMSGG